MYVYVLVSYVSARISTKKLKLDTLAVYNSYILLYITIKN